MAGLLRYSIEEVLYSTSPVEKKSPTHADEAQGVCKSVGKLLQRFEKHSQGEELEMTLVSVVEEEVGDLPKPPLTRVEKSPGGFSFADSTRFQTVIQPDARQSNGKDSAVETPILCRKESGYDSFRVRCDTDSGRTSTPVTPRRFADKPVSQRRLFESPAQPKEEVLAELETKASPPQKIATMSPGYQLYKTMCKEDIRETERLFEFLDSEPSRMESGINSSASTSPASTQPAPTPRPEIVTPKHSQPAPSKTTPKPRSSSLQSNSSEGSSCSSGSEKTFSPSARKEVLAASAKFSKWDSEKLREVASGAAQCRLNVLLTIKFSDRIPEVVAVIETYTQCVMGAGNNALDSLCLALVELNKDFDAKDLTEHEKYAAYKFAKKLEQSQF